MFNIKNKLKSLKKKGKYGAMYMSTVVKVIACVVVGALVISGLAVVTNGAFNTASDKVSTLFEEDYNYAGGAHGGAGGGGAIVPGEGSSAVEITPADGTSVNKAIANKFAFNSSAPIKTVKVDSEVVDPSSYELSEDSATVTFNKSFLSSLAVGTHTVEISTDEGTANTTFAVDWVAGLYDADGNLTISWDELKNTYNLVGTAELNGKTYTSLLGNYATGGMPESYFKTLEGVLVIDDEIENISGFALYECPGITKVICPNGLKAISANNFCYSTLEELQLGSSIEYIGGGTFDYDTSKTLITYSESCANLSKVECYSAISVICNDGTLTSDANGTSWS